MGRTIGEQDWRTFKPKHSTDSNGRDPIEEKNLLAKTLLAEALLAEALLRKDPPGKDPSE